MLFCISAIAYAQYVPRDLMTSDPALNRQIAEAIQQYGEQAVRKALLQGNNNNSTTSYQNNGYNNNYGNNSDRIIQGVYFSNDGRTSLVNLRYHNGQIWNYSTSQNQLGQQNWQSMYPDNPHPTNSTQDGMAARNYRYKVSIGGTYVYFNM